MGFPRRHFIHVSDLHFGRIDTEVIQAFEKFIQEATPRIDLLLITGDLTQRATIHQFEQAAAFLQRLPVEHICAIPGNHDMPMHNPLIRFFAPLSRYRRYISPHVKETYLDSEILVLGLNTQDRFKAQEGRISETQLERHRELYREENLEDRFRILLTHHSLFESRIAEARYDSRREKVLALKPHLILSGHNHRFGVFRRSSDPNELFPLEIKAGTGVSVRTRNEPNSFNWIELEDDEIRVRVHDYDASTRSFLQTQDRSQILRGTPAKPAPVEPTIEKEEN